MSYHVNTKTGNPVACKKVSCELEHFATKEAAKISTEGSVAEKAKLSLVKNAETVAEKASDANDAVKNELKEDAKVTKKQKAKEPETTKDKIEAIRAEIAEEVCEIVDDFRSVATKVTKKTKKSAKGAPSSKKLTKNLVDNFNALAKTAPNHPLVKKGKKVFKNFSK